MKIKFILISFLILIICSSCVNNKPKSNKKTDIENSGPITIPIEDESPSIRNAPAYDKEKAKLYIEKMPDMCSLIENIGDDSLLIAFGNVKPSDNSLKALNNELNNLKTDNHKVSLIMVDLKNMSGVSYHSSDVMCTQSTVKGVYIGSLLEYEPSALEKNGMYIHDAIEFSDNEAYENLRKIYGKEPILKWCRDVGVNDSFADDDYPRNSTARDMLKLWTKLYCFLNSDANVASVGRYFADSAASATKKMLGDKFPVQTKAGWEDGIGENFNYDPCLTPDKRYIDGDPSNDECATNDTGIVYTPDGPYIFVIYSDYPFSVFADYTSENKINKLVKKLYDVKASMVS